MAPPVSVDVLFVSLFAIWAVLGVARQDRMPLRDSLSRWDLFGLVPVWSLFTGTDFLDYRVLVRVTAKDGSLGDWEPIELWRPRPPAASLWHPELTERAIVRHAIEAMFRSKGEAGRGKLCRSVRYRSFLRLLVRTVRARDAMALQFVVYGFRQFEPELRHQVLFLSDVHDVMSCVDDAV